MSRIGAGYKIELEREKVDMWMCFGCGGALCDLANRDNLVGTGGVLKCNMNVRMVGEKCQEVGVGKKLEYTCDARD